MMNDKKRKLKELYAHLVERVQKWRKPEVNTKEELEELQKMLDEYKKRHAL